MSITLALDVGAAPMGGSENVECTVPASKGAFQTAAAEAVSSKGGFIEVTQVIGGAEEKKLINLSKIKAVI